MKPKPQTEKTMTTRGTATPPERLGDPLMGDDMKEAFDELE